MIGRYYTTLSEPYTNPVDPYGFSTVGEKYQVGQWGIGKGLSVVRA